MSQATEINPPNPTNALPRQAFRFVLVLGIVNLFADFTYEGARSVAGPFLGSLGATATAVGLVAGCGELIGYGLRSVTGFIADRTHRYWAVIFIGYFINMFAVPALALAGSWPLAAALIVAERTGKAIRKPAVEAMLAEAGKTIGHGWVFGLNEALDQTGATIGPLVVAWVLWRHGGYRQGFATLLLSAVLCLLTLVVARRFRPRDEGLAARSPRRLQARGFPPAYWGYFAGAALIAAGFTDFALISFHFQRAGILSAAAIPVFYAVAMATGAVSSLVLGRLLDRMGTPIVVAAFALPIAATPLVFLGHSGAALAGMLFWGVGLGAQDALLKAVLAEIIPADRRATGFGVFDTGFGVAWFVGSATLGWLYDRSIPAVVAVSVALQLAGLPLLRHASRREI